MTNPPLENRQVERVLSLLVILYGLQLIIPYLEPVIRLGLHRDEHHPFYTSFSLPPIIAGFLLVYFFPSIVQWLAYFSTARTARSQRQWLAHEICTIPLVCFAFAQFVEMVISGITLLAMMCAHFDTMLPNLVKFPSILKTSILLVQIVLYGFVLTVFLYYARQLAAWLLRRVIDCQNVNFRQ